MTHDIADNSVGTRTPAGDIRGNELRFRLVFERSLDGIVVVDGEGRYRLANQAACELFGYPLAKLLTMRVTEMPTVHAPTTAELFESYLKTGREDIGRVHLRRPDGEERIVEYTAIQIARDEHIGILRDATERERSTLALRRLAAIVASSEDSIVGISTDGLITDWNNGAERIYGYTAAEVVGKPITMLAPPERADQAHDVLCRILQGKSVRNFETVRMRKDGRLIDVCISTSAAVDLTGNIVGHSTISHDVSERKLLERQALEIADQERRRIGQGLHDALGQELTGLGLMAGALSESLEKLGVPEAQIVIDLQGRIKRTVEQVQAISRGLIPVSIDAGGLMAALDGLAKRVEEQAGPTCDFLCREPIALDDNVTANELYRIAQEAANNAVKHANARHIRIDLCADRDLIVLGISDDGIGIRLPLAADAGMGLRIMRYRADLIGAQLKVEAAPAGGTVVRCTLLNWPTT